MSSAPPFPGSIIVPKIDGMLCYHPERFMDQVQPLRLLRGQDATLDYDEPLLVLGIEPKADDDPVPVADSMLLLRANGTVVYLIGYALWSKERLRVLVRVS